MREGLELCEWEAAAWESMSWVMDLLAYQQFEKSFFSMLSYKIIDIREFYKFTT